MVEPIRLSEFEPNITNKRFFLVDKKTLQGTGIELVNDFLGGIGIKDTRFCFCFGNGYYYANMKLGELMETLQNTLSVRPNMAPRIRTKLNWLIESISDNDNNYILYAELKTAN